MPNKQMPPTPVRLPVELKAWIKARAAGNLRSVNAEIVALLIQARALETGAAHQNRP
jgi:hypothetical protein